MNTELVKQQLEKLGFDDVEFTGETSDGPTVGEAFVLYRTSHMDAPKVVSRSGQLRLEPWDYPSSTYAS